jgi:hypothetical protein
VPEILSRVADRILHHRAMISDVSASVIVACLGIPFRDGDSAEQRVTLVNALVSENGVAIRIAHGQCNGRAGNLGGRSRFTYGAVIPGFNSILKRLLDSPAGTVIEVAAP